MQNQTGLDWIAILTLAVAVVALFRPNIENWFRSLKNHIDFHSHPRIEVGFSGFGPTIGLTGSVRALYGSQYVTSMKIVLRRVKDNKTHEFSWSFNRVRKIQNQRDDLEAQLAYPFRVMMGEAIPVDILFNDTMTQELFTDPLRYFQKEYQDFQISYMNQNPSASKDVYDTFLKFQDAHAQKIDDVTSLLDHEFYWDPGAYEIILVIGTSHPTKYFPFKFNFDLTKDESDRLKENTNKIIFAACELPHANFIFENPKAEKI